LIIEQQKLLKIALEKNETNKDTEKLEEKIESENIELKKSEHDYVGSNHNEIIDSYDKNEKRIDVIEKGHEKEEAKKAIIHNQEEHEEAIAKKLNNKKNNLMLEVALNSYEKKNREHIEELNDIRKQTKVIPLEKKFSESMDNLKIESKNGSSEKLDVRPLSLNNSKGFCNSDMTLNSKGNKKALPAFNLSLNEGGIKPFNRSHARNNNNSAFAFNPVGTQSFCYSPSTSSAYQTESKGYRRSMQVSLNYNILLNIKKCFFLFFFFYFFLIKKI